MTYIPKPHIIRPADITSRMERTVAEIMRRAGEDFAPWKPISYEQGVVTFSRTTFDEYGCTHADGESSVRIASRGDRDWLEALCRVLAGPRPDVHRGEPARLSADVQRGTQATTPEDQ